MTGNILNVTSSDSGITSVSVGDEIYKVGDFIYLGDVDVSGNVTTHFKISRSTGLTSFNGRGDPNTPISTSGTDYTWDMVKDGSNILHFGNVVNSPIPDSPDGKVLTWKGNK